MKRLQAIKVLKEWDKAGKYVFTKHQLRILFQEDMPKAFDEGLQRLVKDNLLVRACRGIYINQEASSLDGYTIEHIAKALRPGEYNYVSLESILSEYGVISQIPLDRITIVTTGRKGIYKTPYGIIEYTHTKRDWSEVIKGIKTVKNRPLRIASKEIAWRDLKRVGRNTNMVNLRELNED